MAQDWLSGLPTKKSGNKEPDWLSGLPTKADSQQEPEIPWYHKWIGTGLEIGPSIAGSLIGGGAGLIGGAGVGSIPGTMAGGAVGSAIGNTLRQGYEGYFGLRDEFNPWEVGASTVLGAAPPILGAGKLAAKAGLSGALKYGAKSALSGGVEGAIQGAAGVPIQKWAQTGDITPTWGEVGQGAVAGGLFGTAVGGALGTRTGVKHSRGLEAIANAGQTPPPSDTPFGPSTTPFGPEPKPRISAAEFARMQAEKAAPPTAPIPPAAPPPAAPTAAEVPFDEGKGFPVPKEKLTKPLVEQYFKDGWKLVQRGPNGEGIFKRFIREDEGSSNWHDWATEWMINRIRRRAGREATPEDLTPENMRLIHGSIPGEGEQVPVIPDREEAGLMDSETASAFIDDTVKAIDYWQRRLDEFSNVGDIDGSRLAYDKKLEAEAVLNRLEGRDAYGQKPGPIPPELLRANDLVTRAEQLGKNRPTHDELVQSLWERARELGINPENYRSVGELEDAVERAGEDVFRRGDESPLNTDRDAIDRAGWNLGLDETRVDVFDPRDGKIIRTFDTETEAAEFIRTHPNRQNLDTAPHNPLYGHAEDAFGPKPDVPPQDKWDIPTDEELARTREGLDQEDLSDISHGIDPYATDGRPRFQPEDFPVPRSEIERRQFEIERRYQNSGRAIDKYRLPDGSIVPVDATATKGLQTTDFGMRDGSTVKMEYVGPLEPGDTIDPNTGRVIQLPHLDDTAEDSGYDPNDPFAPKPSTVVPGETTGQVAPFTPRDEFVQGGIPRPPEIPSERWNTLDDYQKSQYLRDKEEWDEGEGYPAIRPSLEQWNQPDTTPPNQGGPYGSEQNPSGGIPPQGPAIPEGGMEPVGLDPKNEEALRKLREWNALPEDVRREQYGPVIFGEEIPITDEPPPGGIEVGPLRAPGILGGGIPGQQMLGPRGEADISIDAPVPPVRGQQELPLGPVGETPYREYPEDAMFAHQNHPTIMDPRPTPHWAAPEDAYLPEIGDAIVNRYLKKEDAIPPEMNDIVMPPESGPDTAENAPLRHPTAQRWDAYMRELDAEGAPDTAYRDIMSTGSKNPLKRGETWRGRVLAAINYFESRIPPETAEDVGGPPPPPPEGPPSGRPPVPPNEGPPVPPDEPFNIDEYLREQEAANKTPKWREWYNLARGLTTTLDFSAPLRQGLPLIFSKEWRQSWKQMMQSYGSEGAYQKTLSDIRSRPLFSAHRNETTGKVTKSWADKAGLRIMDLSEDVAGTLTNREEGLAGNWVESGGMVAKIPGAQAAYKATLGRGARASNRAYTAFLNQLRADTFETLMKAAKSDFDAGLAGSRNPYTDLPYAQEIAAYVNTATGRGPLKTHFGSKEVSLEQHAKLLTDIIFSPRLMASRVRMLNPSTYMMASPFVRKQYLNSLFQTAGAWSTFAGVAYMAGAEVSLDPESADFGKIKIGNTRLDPAGGFQQYLVSATRLVTGHKRSSGTSAERQELGQGYRADTRKDVIERFGVNKLHPVLKFAYDMLNASEYTPFQVGDRTAQLFVPLIMQDVWELAKTDPGLLPLVIPPVAAGMGTQTYEKGEAISKFLPKEYDISFEGGNLWDSGEPTEEETYYPR